MFRQNVLLIPILAAESVTPQANNRMQRPIGSPATAWQTAQSNMTTFDRATPSAEREIYTLPETIALNSQSEQSLRDAGEVKSSPYLGSVALTNDRQSKLLQAAHLAIADQSPFKLRSADPKISTRNLSTSQDSGFAPQGLVEVSSSTVSAPLPPRTTFDAFGKPFTRSADVSALPKDAAAAAANVAHETHSLKLAAITSDGERAHPEVVREVQSYRGASNNYIEGSTQRDIHPYVPASGVFPQRVEAPSFNAAPTGQSPDIADSSSSHAGFLNAAWGVADVAAASPKGSLNSLFPNAGNSLKKASVSFDAGLPTAKTASNIVPDTGLSKVSKAGDVLNTGRIATPTVRLKDSGRVQDCASLPLFDTTSMRNKFQADNVTFSKSISPNGERMQVQTAPDFSSLTEVWSPSANGAYLYKSVYRDELNRVRFEESVDAQGSKTILQTGYCDREDKKSPFVAYKMLVKPDGSRELLT
jgi:hypothetical protein